MAQPPSRLRRFPWSPLLCFGLAWLVTQADVVRQLEWRTLDWRTRFRRSFQPPPDPRIGVVLFEDNTDSAISWPPPRNVHGALIEMLGLIVKPKVITFDVILDIEREPVDGVDGDALMMEGIKAAVENGVKVVTAAVTGPDEELKAPEGQDGPTRPLVNVEGDLALLEGDKFPSLLPFPKIRSVSWYGFADTPPGPDGMRREIPMLVRVGDKAYPSLALQTLLAYFDVPIDAVRVRLGDAVYLPTKDREIRIPVSRSGRYFLNYRYDQEDLGGHLSADFATYSYLEILIRLEDRRNNVPFARSAPPLAGGVVFIGQTVTGKADEGPTPLSGRVGKSPLVLVHANILNNVLHDDYVRRVPDWIVWAGGILLGYAGLVLGLRRSIWAMGAFAVLSVAIYVTAAFSTWNRFNLWLPLVGPLAGFVALEFIIIGRRAVQEKRGRDQVKQMFGSYLAPQLVSRMVKSGQTPELGGHEEEITAYFSDIQSFSTFSEKLTPARLVELMNEFLTLCTDVVQDEGGTLDKYIGDAVVAMFGAPLPLPPHAYRACVASQKVQAALVEFRARLRKDGTWPDIVCELRARIGLNTGRAIVGNMGSRRRFSYTMMSDDVNLAARMESGAKSWGVYTMCTEVTRSQCLREGGDRVVFRPLGRIVVVGRTTPVPVHEIVGLRETLPASALECIALFSQGMDRYLARDWDGARQLFEQSAKLEPNQPGPAVKTNPSLLYAKFVDKYRLTPPPADWDGVHVMSEK